MNCLLHFFAVLFVVGICGCSKSAKVARYTARGDEYARKEEFSKAEVEYLNANRLEPEDVGLLRKLADLYCEQGRNVSALGALTLVIKSEPNDPDIRFKLSKVRLALNDYRGAREEAIFVATNQPTNAAALVMLAETSISTNQLIEAARLIDRAVRQFPGPVIFVASAAVHARQRNLVLAEDQLKQATRLDPTNVEVDSAWAKLRLAQTNSVEGEVFLKRAADNSPPRSTHRLEWADYRVARGDFASAAKSMEEITLKVPDFVPPWIRLAEIALNENRLEDCERLTKRILRLEESSYEGLMLRARLFSTQGKFESALTLLTQLDAMFVSNSVVKFELARAHFGAGDLPKALVFVDEVLRVDPRHVQGAILQAKINLSAGNVAAASRTLVDLRKTRPDLREAGALLASIYAGENRLDEAIAIYREAALRYPQDPEPSASIGLVLLMAKQDTSAARAAFEQSYKISPTYVTAVEMLVNLDIADTNFPSGLARATALQSSLTNSAVGHLLEARVHSAAKDTKSAEAALLEGAKREPNSPVVVAALADLYVKTGDREKALKQLDNVIAGSTNAFAAWTQKGMLFEQQEQTDKAIDAYEHALAINKDDPLALNNLAFLLSQSRSAKKLDEAVALATRAREVAPGDADIADTLGWILFQRKDFAGARRVLAEAVQNLPRDSSRFEMLYHAARAEYAVAYEAAARERFNRSIEGTALPDGLRHDALARLAVLSVNAASPSTTDIQNLEAAAKNDNGDYLAHFRLAQIYERTGRTNDAIKSLEAASRANPQSAAPLLALARLSSAYNPDRALRLARDGRKLAPNDPVGAAWLGTLSVRARDYSSGLSLLLEAQRDRPLDGDALYYLAIAQLAHGLISEASVNFSAVTSQAATSIQQRAKDCLSLLGPAPLAQKSPTAEARLKADPDDFLALATIAEIQLHENEPRKAASLFEKTLVVAPGFWPARHQLAALYIDQLNNERAAYSHATRAREDRSSDPQLARILGKIAFKRGNMTEALTLLQESTAPGLTNGEPYYLMGVANFRLKRTNDAKLALLKANSLHLQPDLAADSRRILTQLK